MGLDELRTCSPTIEMPSKIAAESQMTGRDPPPTIDARACARGPRLPRRLPLRPARASTIFSTRPPTRWAAARPFSPPAR